VRGAADPRVVFLGFKFGDDYHALQANARLYIQATEVGGTHPALVEAMGHRNAIVAHDVPEHHEVLGDAGRYFARGDRDDLAAQLGALLGDDAALEDLRQRAARRVADRYSWEAVTDAYEEYLVGLVHGTPSAHA
jgi:glycosyltransferase involved in cell wall biosynthesis